MSTQPIIPGPRLVAENAARIGERHGVALRICLIIFHPLPQGIVQRVLPPVWHRDILHD